MLSHEWAARQQPNRHVQWWLSQAGRAHFLGLVAQQQPGATDDKRACIAELVRVVLASDMLGDDERDQEVFAAARAVASRHKGASDLTARFERHLQDPVPRRMPLPELPRDEGRQHKNTAPATGNSQHYLDFLSECHGGRR